MVPLVVLCILDGWGVAPDSPGNAVTSAKTPNFNSWRITYPHTTLLASGEAVGLPKGEVGNTETGHLNLGAGRIVYQDLLRINHAITDGSFFSNQTLLKAIKHCHENNSNLHLMGLLGSGGVHASAEHLFALLKLCQQQNFTRVFLHLFTDGRDSSPTASLHLIEQLEHVIKQLRVGKIASVMGRYWAMDRDNRWERTEKAYNALTKGEGILTPDIKKAIEESFEKGITDEFINPTLVKENDKPIALIQENDSVIFYNFRIDRPRQLTRAFIFDDFNEQNKQAYDFDPYAVEYFKTHLLEVKPVAGFARGEKIKNLFFVTMTEYEKNLNPHLSVAFPPINIIQPLGGVISTLEKRQLRIAESEKERFVTFYFNGQQELTFENEVRIIVPSKKVGTYDKAPEMSAREITESFLKSLGDHNELGYSFVLINFANADMVGHTGNFEATKKACEVIDECLGKVVDKVNQLGGVTLITADHGNAEEKLKADGSPNTEHTGNPVPLLIIGNTFQGKSQLLERGILADVAPTVLKLLGIDIPSEMTGRSLI